MRPADIAKAYEPLSSFLSTIGFPVTQHAAFDKSQEFLVNVSGHPPSALRGLSYQSWMACTTAFAAPHLVMIELTAADSIVNTEPLDEHGFRQFKERINDRPCRVEIRIDKNELCRQWGLHTTTRRGRVYFFAEAFEALLANTLAKPSLLEEALWGNDAGAGLLILLRDRDLRLEGTWLDIVGGRAVRDLELPPLEIDLRTQDAVHQMWQRGRDGVRWDSEYAPGFLTPSHLQFAANLKDAAGSLVELLLAHWTNLSIAYLANRIIQGDTNELVALFESSKRKCELRLFHDVSGLTPFIEDARAVGDAAEWAYQEERQPDRLRMARIVIAREFANRNQPVPAIRLTGRAIRLWKDLQWQWIAFIENKLDEFSEKAADFETDVATTVESFDEQVADIIKGLSTTIITAIGVLVGAIVAAATKNTVSLDVIRKALWAYGLYLVVVPGLLTMSHGVSRIRAIQSLFSSRRERFMKSLPEEYVQRLSKEQIDTAERRFWYAMGANLIVLLIAIVGCISLASHVESFRSQP